MKEDEYYVVDDVSMFVDSTRKIVFSAFGHKNIDDESDDIFDKLEELNPEETKEMEDTLSLKESISIFKNYAKFQKNKKTKKERAILTGSNFDDFIEALNARLVSNLLMILVKKGLIESAYDQEANDFVFWVKDTTDNKDNKDENS